MHSLIARQVRKYCKDNQVVDLEGFVQAIDDAYAAFENDRLLIENSLEVMSRELGRRNAQLADQLAGKQQIMDRVMASHSELIELNRQLDLTKSQLLQADKMASIGQLAAGVAHEINNPIGYIYSNFSTLQSYIEALFRMLHAYKNAEESISDPAVAASLARLRRDTEIDFLQEDIPLLMTQSKDGLERVRTIVQNLKDFSHVDAQQTWSWFNLKIGIDSTLNIVSNEIKYCADVVREYGDVPDIQCLSSQINQVAMNLIINAAHAIGQGRGTITIRTGTAGDRVWFSVTDTGCGIAPENLARIFDPFFTTKPVGKGTGLGLSVSYGIVKHHGGNIEVESEVGKGTTFRVLLPMTQEEPPKDD
jgi:two-component system NtrC family sensor kinase